MTRVAAIGECMLELSGAGESWRMGHAGDSFNTLWGMRALLDDDAELDFVSAFGDDPFSRQQIDFFAANGIGTGHSPRITGARPGLYAITLEGAERSFTYWRSDAAARRLADDMGRLEKSLENRSLVYFSGITLAILKKDDRARLLRAIEGARKAGSWIAFDPNYRAKLWEADEARAAITAALGVCDVVLPTFPDEADLFGDGDARATIERIRQSCVGEIVVKDGTEPAFVVSSSTAEPVCVPARQAVRALDTTGAGDGFNGGYLAARLSGHEAEEAARIAHRVAARVVQVRGALADFDSLRAAFSQD